MIDERVRPAPPPIATRALAACAAISLAFHLAIAGNYGWFRDELYYIAAGKHLARGYVEFPLLIALLSAFERAVFGTSLTALHVLPAVASAATVVAIGLMARELGGGRLSQTLAALGGLTAPVFLGSGALFTMDVFDELWWVLAALLLLRILTLRGDATADAAAPARMRIWLLFGMVAFVALLTKLTFLAFGLAITVGLLATPARAELRTRGPYVAAALGLLGLLPYLRWQISHDWATLAFWHQYSHTEDTVTFVVQVILLMQPLALPLWLVGLWYLLRDPDGTPYRPLAWAFLFLLVLFVAGHAKSYFLVPAIPPLLAAGAVRLERHLRRHPRTRLVPLTVAGMVVGGMVLAPVVAPVLPPRTLASIMRSPIQPVADRFGWPQYIDAVAAAYRSLSPADRARTTILAGNYGEAGALDLLGPAAHLPRAISPQNTYWFWGRGVTPGRVVIATDIDPAVLSTLFASVTDAGSIQSQDGIQNEEVGRQVWICRGLKLPWAAAWARLQNFS